jgi:hypothetical protein
VAGLAAWVACAAGGDVPRAWRALLINFIFFTPLAAGMVLWPAVLRLCEGKWSKTIEPTALSALAFAPLSLVAFVLLWLGKAHWAAWTHAEHLHNAAWLNPPFLFTRDLVGLLVFWGLAAWFVRRARQRTASILLALQSSSSSSSFSSSIAVPVDEGGEESRTRTSTRTRTMEDPGDPPRAPGALAAWLAFAYCVVFTLLAFDLVMALDPHWFSTLFGAYFFMSGLYGALAAWTLIVILGGRAEVEQRHDLGRLFVAFSLITTYMMFSQLLPIWYENFPEEARFVLPRLRTPPWPAIGVVLLAVVYLGPLVALLTRWAKRTPWFLGLVSLAVLAGLWVERWWLVTPTLGGSATLGVPEVAMTASFVAAMALSMGGLDRRLVSPPQGSEAG